MPQHAVLISCFDWYRERLAPIRERLMSMGYTVTVLTADFDHVHSAPVEERIPECTYIHVPPYRRNLSVQRIASHLAFGKAVGKWLKSRHPNLVYCLVPPNSTADACRRYKQANPDSRLVLDLIDLWPESLPLRGAKDLPPARLWGRLRDDSIAAADHVFTECALYQKQLEGVLDGSKATVLPLFKETRPEDRRLVQQIIDRRSTEEKVLKFAYLGSMNNILDVDGICAVLRGLRDTGYACMLHAVGDGESRAGFQQAVQASGCRACFYGPIFEESEKIRILAPCDYAFNMMKEGVAVGLTMKSIDYLAYGLPLINNIPGDTRDLVEEAGIGVNFPGREGLVLPLREVDHRRVLEVYDRMFTKASFLAALDGGLA